MTAPDRRGDPGEAVMELNRKMRDETFDGITPFIFNDCDLRGGIVRTRDALRDLIGDHPYPRCVRDLLAEMQAAVCLMTSIMKFEGEIMLQLRGGGNLRYAILNSNEKHETRGLASLDGKIPEDASFRDLLSDRAVLTITVMPNRGNRYQGIIALEGNTLAECLESYYTRSMQIPTRLWLFSDANCSGKAAGLLIQALPSGDRARQEEDFARAGLLADTVTMAEILTLTDRELLYRLYHAENVTVFGARPVTFRCSCSRERYRDMLTQLNPDELARILQQDGQITAECHCCGKKYVFGHEDVIGIIRDAKSHRM